MNNDVESPEPVGAVERMMMSAVPLWVLGLVVFGLLLVAIALMVVVHTAAEGNRRYGALGDAALLVAETPSTIRGLFEDQPFDVFYATAPRLPNGFSRIDPTFHDPGYLLMSRPDAGRKRNVVQIIRLSDRKILKEYLPDIDGINRRSSVQSPVDPGGELRGLHRYRLEHPLLMSDGGLVFHGDSPLVRIDACGRTLWTINGHFGHSIQQDADGMIWVQYLKPKTEVPATGPRFIDEAMAEISPDGHVVKMISIADVLRDNGLDYLWRGRPYTRDAFHINEIQPVLTSGKYWQKGDLFVSLRSLSMVMLYRPSTGKILWHSEQPWIMQHDVEIVNDHMISVFDNHVASGYVEDGKLLGEVDGHSKVTLYDFATNTYTDPYDNILKRENLQSWREGRSSVLPNGDLFLEETVFGRVMRFSKTGQMRWQYIAADDKNRRFVLNWTRYLYLPKSLAAINAAVSARCS